MDVTKIENFNTVTRIDKNLSGAKISDVSEKKFDQTSTRSQTNKDLKELNSAVNKANKVLFKNNTHLQFRVHEKTNEVMVKIVDDETGDVLKEIPPEKLLDMVAKLWEIAGIIVDEKA